MASQLSDHLQIGEQKEQKRSKHCSPTPSSTEHCIQNYSKSINMPDEVWLRIFSLVAESTGQPEKIDPLRLGWRDEAETFSQVRQRLAELAPFRLVSRHFLHLSTPFYFQEILVGKQHNRLANLLTASPPPRFRNGLAGNPYGHHVREILIESLEPHVIIDLLHSIHALVPRVVQLSSLRLSLLPCLLSPAIVFPELQSFSELSGVPMSIPTTLSCQHSTSLSSMEIFLGLLNHHPLLRRLSCRGFELDPTRFINVLRSSLLAVPLLGHLRSSAIDFAGLQMLHFGLDCVLDVELLQLLPSAAPALEQLHVDAGCQIEDKKSLAHGVDRWTLANLVAALPGLTEFTFIGRKSLPNPETDCWECEDILKVGLALKHLNLRMDSIGPGILCSMQQLERMNVWHSPPVYGYEGWGIVSIDQPAKAGILGSALVVAGLSWPRDEDGRKDMWIKLKSLIPVRR